MPETLKLGEAVMIQWEDSCCASGWKEDSALGGLEASECVSVGWIARKTDRSITIAPHVGVNDGVVLRQTNGHMMIPISAIRHVRRLKLPTLDKAGKNRPRPSATTLSKLTEVLECSIEDLLQ